MKKEKETEMQSLLDSLRKDLDHAVAAEAAARLLHNEARRKHHKTVMDLKKAMASVNILEEELKIV